MLGVKVEGKLDTVVGPETELKGDVSVRGSMRLDGRIEGNLSVMDSLYMGSSAHVHGDVHCKDGVIAGKVEGNLVIQGALELQSGATVIGDVKCKSLVLAKDAFLDGRVTMREESAT
jgi:cytoskeletal protein CcmA (bactofilin family)